MGCHSSLATLATIRSMLLIGYLGVYHICNMAMDCMYFVEHLGVRMEVLFWVYRGC